MITDDDREFARELVKLARRFGAGKLSVDFALNSSTRFRRADQSYSYQDVKMWWREGRHGAAEEINLSAQVLVTEKEEIDP